MFPTLSHTRILTALVAALATAACQASAFAPAPAFQLDRQGASLVVVVAPAPATAAYRAQYLPVQDWDYAEAELSRPGASGEPIALRADAEADPDTGRRTATLTFSGLAAAEGYRLTVSLYREGSDGTPEQVGTETRESLPVGAGDHTVTLERLFRREAAPTPAPAAALAGMVTSLPAGGVAARLGSPSDVVVDSRGVVYVLDTDNGGIRRVAPDGGGRWWATTLAGTGYPGFANGPGHLARFVGPLGMALGPDGALYVAENANRLRKLTFDAQGHGTVSSPSCLNAPGEPGAGAAATFGPLYAIAAGTDGTLYLAEKTRVRKLTPRPDGAYDVAAFAGMTIEGNEDGGGATAKFHTIRDLVVDAAGVVYASDAGNHKIRRLTPVAGAGASVSTVPMPAGVTLASPRGLAWDSAGRLLVGDQGTIRRFDLAAGPTPTVTTLLGAAAGFADGTGTAARFDGVAGLAVAPDGALWVADVANHRLRRATEMDGAWRSETRVGDGTAGNMNGPAEVVAPLGRPTGVAVMADGTIVLADAVSNKILAIDARGEAIRTLAGTGGTGRVDGAGATATFNAPDSVCVAKDGSLVVAEALNNSLRRLRVGADGAVTVSTITTALQYPGAVTEGPDGAFYVTEAGHPTFTFLGSHRVRKVVVAPDGAATVTTLAGGSSGFADGVGTAARFNRPTGIAVAADGTIYVADAENHRLRKLVTDAATGQITTTTIAGTGTKGKGGATIGTLLLDRPTAVALDAAGRLLVTDYWNHRLLALSFADQSVTTLAGLTGDGYSDGPIAQARFSRPVALALDGKGAILVVDAHPYGVRKVSL